MNLLRKISLLSLLVMCLPQQNVAQYGGSLQVESLTESTYYWQEKSFVITSGVGARFWVSDFLALNYELQSGYDSKYGFTLNTGWGQLASIALFAKSASDSTFSEAWACLAILSLIAPEGVTFATNVYDNIIFMPYINPLEVHIIPKDPKTFLQASGEVGFKLHLEFDDFVLRPKFGMRFIYGQKRVGVNFGLSILLTDP